MRKFRKKPVEIEAIQFTLENVEEIFRFIYEDNIPTEGKFGRVLYKVKVNNTLNIEKINNDDIPIIYISTLEGDMEANVNDYIIKGIKGEFYPCKPDIFELSYENVETQDNSTQNNINHSN